MRIAVIGCGAWGTTLACLLHEGGHHVALWGHIPEWLQEIRASGLNERFLPGIPVPAGIALHHDTAEAIRDAECVVVAVPSKVFRQVTGCLSNFPGIVVTVTKGIEYDSGLTMSGILASTAPKAKHAALSGPSFAVEVAHGVPTAIVAASGEQTVASAVQQLFTRPKFRVYTSNDILGVELGGALKNVIAIAAGVSDGLGFGDNSKAALVTRAIVEMRRLGVACGAQPDTFTGLSGLGDLMVTCFSRHSRNRGFGERVGKGESPADISASMVAVAEGHPTAKSARQLARKYGAETPVVDEVYSMLYEGKNPLGAVDSLLGRDSKPELAV